MSNFKLNLKMKKPIICIVGTSGSGKTFFIERLIPELKKRGIRVFCIKHDVHDRFEIDKPGKDSWRHKKAGAVGTIISSPKRIGIIMDTDHDHDPEELLKYIDLDKVDLVLAEGYKKSRHLKIEVSTGNKLMCENDPFLIAVISNHPKKSSGVPYFKKDQAKEVAEFIIKKLDLL